MVSRQNQQETSTTKYYTSNSHVKVNSHVNVKFKEKWLKFYDRQDPLKFTLILYADFDSTLKPVDQQYK